MRDRSNATTKTYQLSPGRFMAVIDSDPTFLDESDSKQLCEISSPQNVYPCTAFDPTKSTYFVGHGDYNGVTTDFRLLDRFDLSEVPVGSQVVDAHTDMLNATTANSTPISVGIYPLLQPFDANVTWNDAAAATPWHTPGGDLSGDAASIATVPQSGTGAFTWDTTQLAQEWINGAAIAPGIENDGVAIAPADPTPVTNFLQIDAFETSDFPTLFVTYEEDRTAPTIASLDLDATYDADSGQTTVSWTPAVDPPFADGRPGSGVSGYTYRYQLNGGAWSSWQVGPDPWFTLSVPEGTTITAQVQPGDIAGNVGEISSGTDTATESDMTPDNVGDMAPGETGDDAPVDPEPADPTDLAPAVSAMPNITGQAQQADDDFTVCSGASPCGSYDGQAAAAFAIHWNLIGQQDSQARNDHDPNYGYFGGLGGDCTNFASQAIKAGGVHFERTKNRKNDPNSNFDQDQFVKGTGSWWSYFFPELGVPFSRAYETTQSWTHSNDLYNEIIENGLGHVVNGRDHVHVGDLVFFNLAGTTLGNFDHTQIVTGITHHHIWVSQHSAGYRKTFADVLAGLHAGTFSYVFVHLDHTGFNIPN